MGLGGDWLRRKVALVGQQRSMLLSRNSRTSMRVRFSCSQRLYSMASPIVLPHDEIEDIWFGGYNFTPGNPPPMEALKRWFYKDPQFDATCQHPPHPITNQENTNPSSQNSLPSPSKTCWSSLQHPANPSR
jgi:hypothetical protein